MTLYKNCWLEEWQLRRIAELQSESSYAPTESFERIPKEIVSMREILKPEYFWSIYNRTGDSVSDFISIHKSDREAYRKAKKNVYVSSTIKQLTL